MRWMRKRRHTIALVGAAVFIVVGGILAGNPAPNSEAGGVRNVAVEYPYYSPSWSEESAPARANPTTIPNTDSSTPSLAVFFDSATKKETVQVQSDSPARLPVSVMQEAPSPAQDIFAGTIRKSLFNNFSRLLSREDTRTPEQRALYAYGNKLGSLIKNFEATHGDVTQVLKTFFDSRVDPSKAAAIPEIADAYAQLTRAIPSASGSPSAPPAARVRTVANDYAELGTAIENIADIPPAAKDMNAKFAASYRSIGNGLLNLAETGDNEKLLEAINAYNTTAEESMRTYIALVDLFSTYGVKFSASDPGSIFSFNSGGGS